MPHTSRTPLLLVLMTAAWAGDARSQARINLTMSASAPVLSDLRRAASQWQLRAGPSRRVVDQVCLVPDAATFYEALATWDEGRYFPILIDDVELDLKFLRAFRPARVVRYPGRGRPIESGREWDRAVAAVGDAWSADGAPAEGRPRGDRPPGHLGKTPPGAVVGRPESPALPGLAALAAGRFQPMVRLDAPGHYPDLLAPAAADAFSDALDAALRAAVPDFARLGDDCDFLTLAGDYPYRYTRAAGPGLLAVDDRVGRGGDGRRWAFAGRLTGDARRSVYAAMCSLFLRPESALLFDTYSETDPTKKFWGLGPALARLAPALPARLVNEPRATIAGWHAAFAAPGRPGPGLVFINSQGQPRVFAVTGGLAHALDVMPSAPSAVSMIHSYSAADPADPDTIAGRWLAQGAFLYHGSVDEPYLPAFRPPAAVADLLAIGVPFAAAVRPMPGEPYGEPWKLVVLGDPLYTITRPDDRRPRSLDYPAPTAWVAYAATPPPAPDAPEASRLAWAVNAALVQTTARAAETSDGIAAVLRSVDRARLPGPLRPIHDDLLAAVLYQMGRFDGVRAAVAAVPGAERSPASARLATSAMLAEFSRALAAHDFDRGAGAWSALIRSGADAEFQRYVTARLASIADTPSRRDTWRARLRAALPGLGASEARAPVADELKRVEALIAADRPGPGR